MEIKNTRFYYDCMNRKPVIKVKETYATGGARKPKTLAL